MRKALFVGINYYRNLPCLDGCVNDARAVCTLLRLHEDGSHNFSGRLLLSDQADNPVTIHVLRSQIDELFSGEPDVALLYFAGHGSIDKYSTYLCSSESSYARDAMSLQEIMDIAELSHARHKIIILDCCHSGGAGSSQKTPYISTLPNNTTILAACRGRESAEEIHGHGLFTALLLGALCGGAKTDMGNITLPGIYMYIESCLGAWDQRPVFKTNIDQVISLKRGKSPMDPDLLRQMHALFPNPDYDYPLDPTYEEDKRHALDTTRNTEHEQIFRILRKLNQLHLVEPVGEEYMYWAAIKSKSCRLTTKGYSFWRLVDQNSI